MTKVQLHVMLVLHNVRMILSNVRKKNKGATKCDKSTSHVMLILHNVRIIPSNVRKKIRKLLNVTSTVTCDVGTAQ